MGDGRSTADIIWTYGTGAEPFGSAYTISYAGSPDFGKWDTISFAFGVSQTQATSSTLYSVEISLRDDKTFYDDMGIVANVANSGPDSTIPKDWSATVYPVKGAFGSATNAKQYFYAGVSFPAAAPGGIYKWHLDILGTYSMTDGTHSLYETHSYTYYDRDRSTSFKVNQSGTDDWKQRSAHTVFKGGKKMWMFEPYHYRADDTNFTEIGGQVISAADEILGGVSRTDYPLRY